MATDNNNKERKVGETFEKDGFRFKQREDGVIEQIGKVEEKAGNIPADEAAEAAQDSSEPLLEENDVPDSLSAEDFDLDISDEVKKQEELQSDITKEMKPTTLERDIQRGLLDVREQVDEIELDQKEELLNLEKSGIGTIAGMNLAEESISKRDALKIEALQREESNLLDRLGLEEEARKTRLNTAKEQLRQNRENIDLKLKIRDRIKEREKAQRRREEEMTTREKKNLDDFVNMLSGTDPANYTAKTQAEIARLAGETGVPFDAIMNKLQLEYDKRIADLSDQNGTDIPQSSNIIADQLLSGSSPEEAKRIAAFGKFTIKDSEGNTRTISLSSSEQENVINAINAKSDGDTTPPPKQAPTRELNQTERTKALNWLESQPDFTESDRQKFQTNPQFRNWVLRKSNQFEQESENQENEEESTGGLVGDVFGWVKSLFN